MTLMLLLAGADFEAAPVVPDSYGYAYPEEVLIYKAQVEEVWIYQAQVEEVLLYGAQLKEEQ